MNSTVDLLAKVQLLADKAKTDVEAKAASKQNDKREVWARLQKESPEAAAFFKAMNTHFGRPEKVAVKFDGDDWVTIK